MAMSGRIVLQTLTTGLLLLTLAVWMRLYWMPRQRHAFALLALGITTANASFASATSLYFGLRPSSHFLPPWQDLEILQLGMLCLLAPIGMILGIIAAFLSAPKWVIGVVEVASLPLLVVGIMAGMAV